MKNSLLPFVIILLLLVGFQDETSSQKANAQNRGVASQTPNPPGTFDYYKGPSLEKFEIFDTRDGKLRFYEYHELITRGKRIVKVVNTFTFDPNNPQEVYNLPDLNWQNK